MQFCLCPYAPHPHVERRYLVVPGIRSSRIYILDIKPDPRNPSIVKIIEPEELYAARVIRALIRSIGDRGGYILAHWALRTGMDLLAFSFWITLPLRSWEMGDGPGVPIPGLRFLVAYHSGHPVDQRMGHTRPNRERRHSRKLLQGRYGHQVHVWDLRKRRHIQALELGKEYQMVLELRPAHDPTKTYGFAGVVVSLKDLSASIWLWHRQDGAWQIGNVIEIPAEPAVPEKLPPLLKGFKAVPPFVTDIDLSLDDGFFMSPVGARGNASIRCFRPFPSQKDRLGEYGWNGASDTTSRPSPTSRCAAAHKWLKLVATASASISPILLCPHGDEQFYPAGVGSWMVKLDAAPEGEVAFDTKFFMQPDNYRIHQIRLEGGDSSSDSFCYP